MNAAPRMLPKQTEFASNPLLNKQNEPSKPKRRRRQYFSVWLSNTKSNPATTFFFFLPLLQISSKFASFGIEHWTTTFLQYTRVATAAAAATTTRIALFLGSKNYDCEKRRQGRRVAREPTRKRQVNRRIRGQQTTVRVM